MRGERPDPTDDVFSIGVIWFQLAIGNLSAGRPGGSRWRANLHAKGLPPELGDVMESCFEEDPGDRPVDAGALAEGIRQSLRRAAARCCERGRAEIDQVHLDRAIESFREALRLAPRSPEARQGLADATLALEDYESAVMHYSEIIAECPNDAVAILGRALAFARTGQHDRAIDDLEAALRFQPGVEAVIRTLESLRLVPGSAERVTAAITMAIRKDPDNARLLYLRGRAYLSSGNSRLAARDFSEVIRVDPRHAPAYLARGECFTRRKKYAQAMSDLSEAIRLNPELKDAYWERGALYQSRGTHGRAVADFSEFIRFEPNAVDAYVARACSRLQRGEFEQALADLDTVQRLSPDLDQATVEEMANQILALRGDALFGLGMTEQAVACYQRLLNHGARCGFRAERVFRFYMARGESKVSAGDSRGAEQDFQQAINLSSNLVRSDMDDAEFNSSLTTAYCYEAKVFASRGDYLKAITFYSVALEHVDEGDQELVSEILFERGRAYFNSGDYDDAASNFEESLATAIPPAERAAERACLLKAFGDIKLAAGDVKSAAKMFETAMKVDPSNAEAVAAAKAAWERMDAP